MWPDEYRDRDVWDGPSEEDQIELKILMASVCEPWLFVSL